MAQLTLIGFWGNRSGKGHGSLNEGGRASSALPLSSIGTQPDYTVRPIEGQAALISLFTVRHPGCRAEYWASCRGNDVVVSFAFLGRRQGVFLAFCVSFRSLNGLDRNSGRCLFRAVVLGLRSLIGRHFESTGPVSCSGGGGNRAYVDASSRRS